jgi:putative ABC transport system substrate-binding protein
MRRRESIALLGGAAAAWPLAARAQQPEHMRRIAVVMLTADDADGQGRITALREGLEKLGWTEGRNLRIDTRWAAGDADRMRTYVTELAQANPDVILANGSPAVAALRRETRSIPIVFAAVIIRSGRASFPTWRVLAAILLASPTWSSLCLGKCWNCSRG